MEKHVTILGIIHIAFNALLVLIALIVFVVLIGGGLLSGEEEAIIGTGMVGSVVACILLVLSIPGILGGVGLLKRWSWARILVLVLAVLNILNFPLGTAVGAYSLWVLLNEETTQLFNN